MARLTTRTRKALQAGAFAGPDRSYPNARNALARVASKPAPLKARVRAAVLRKYPGIDKPGLINR